MPSGVVPRCGVLCRSVRCFAVLPLAVRAALCVFCRCVVVCAVFAAVRCAASALWCYPRAFSKPEKTVSYFQKTEKISSRWFALCTLSSLHARIPHTEKTSLLFFSSSLALGWCAPQVSVLSLWVASSGCWTLCTCSERGGKRDGDGAVVGGEGTWRRKRGERQLVQGRNVLENFFEFYALLATSFSLTIGHAQQRGAHR